jgi:hypothetical protein
MRRDKEGKNRMSRVYAHDDERERRLIYVKIETATACPLIN